MTQYSNAEVNLIEKISPHWGDIITKSDINPPDLYKILAYEAFINNSSGPEFDALRRVCRAIYQCKIYRMTKEFDKLCEF